MRPKQISTVPQTTDQIPSERIPADVVTDSNRKFPVPPYDQSTFEYIESIRHEAKYLRTPKPQFVTPIIESRARHRAVSVREIKVVRDYKVVDVVYTLDKNHIRRSSTTPHDPAKKNFLLLGCSYPFGVGVNDEDTITGYLTRDIKHFNFYNLGVPGGGLSNALDDIYHQDRISAISKKGGVVIYHYWYDQFVRYFADSDVVRELDPMPHQQYSVIENKLVPFHKYDGLSSVKIFFIKLIERSEFLYFVGGKKLPHSVDHQKRFLRLLEYIKDFYKANYNLDFYLFVMNPESIPSRYFLDQLGERNIKYILYDQLPTQFPIHEIVIPADGHFNPKGNYIFSRLIKEKLKKDGYPGF